MIEVFHTLFIYRTLSSNAPFSSHLTTSEKLNVVSPHRRANTSTDDSDDVGERVSYTEVYVCVYMYNYFFLFIINSL